MYAMVLRNLRLYFRDRVSVFFSLLSVMITLGLYVFFLSDMMMQGTLEHLDRGKEILDLWLLGGLLSITAITSTLASYGVMVNDRYRKIMKDFNATSFPQWKLTLSYVFAAIVTGMIMSIFTFVVGQIFVCLNGGQILSVQIMVKVFFVMLLCVSTGSAMMFFLSCFLYTNSSLSNASVLVGTLIGFLMGIYIPMGTLPAFAQNVIRFFPMTQGCAMYRRILVENVFQDTASNIPSEMLSMFQQETGVVLQYGDISLTLLQNGGILIITCIVFYVLSLCFFTTKQK